MSAGRTQHGGAQHGGAQHGGAQHGGADDGGLYEPCARHDQVAAAYRCCECGKHLCEDCIEVGSHLNFCRLCGERAIELDEWQRPMAPGYLAPPSLAPSSRMETNEIQVARETSGAGGAVLLVNHAVIPAATIAMVSALLFFLLDVRSVFLLGTEALKWVGFCFVTATVLIARYGHMSSDTERQGCYKLALAGATLLAMTVFSMRASTSDSFVGLSANLLIIAAVWRFATRLTAGLSMEGGLGQGPGPRLYGLEQLQLEAWRRQHGVPPDPTWGARGAGAAGATSNDTPGAGTPGAGRSAAGGNPGAPVARLAAIGIVAFALGEPFLLSGPPAVGKRALGAMIVFLLAAGVVMAAGSALGTLRRVRSAAGQASLDQIPGRVASAGLVMVMLLALALALPGIEYRGTGTLRPPVSDDGVDGGDVEGDIEGGDIEDGDVEDGDVEGGDVEDGEADDGSGAQGQGQGQPRDRRESESAGGKQRASEGSGEATGSGEQGFSKAASELVGQMAALGKWLRYVALALVAALALWGLRYLLSHFGSVRRRLRNGLGGFFRRLLAAAGSLFRQRRKTSPMSRADPLADLQGLRDLEPREAVLAAYRRLLSAFEVLEHERPERHTPYEFLASIPVRLKAYADPAKRLTDVYVRVAYGTAAADGADRQGAMAALEEVKVLIDERQP